MTQETAISGVGIKLQLDVEQINVQRYQISGAALAIVADDPNGGSRQYRFTVDVGMTEQTGLECGLKVTKSDLALPLTKEGLDFIDAEVARLALLHCRLYFKHRAVTQISLD
jgi:hypothetical protein